MRITRLNQLVDRGKVINGRWKVGPNDEVVYQSERDGKEEVRFKAALIAAEPDLLVLGVTQRKTRTRFETSLIKLRGLWQANDQNEISFELDSETGKRNVLTFQGSWKLNDSHEIIYTRREARLKTKIKKTQALVIKGHWDVTEKNRLTYYVGGDHSNALRFRGAFQSQSILAKKGEIRYQLGAELQRRSRARVITLFGTWKFSRRLELSFEVEYAQGIRKKIQFGGAVLMRPDSKLEVLLTARNGEPLGVELIFTRDLFKANAQLFVRLKKTADESAVEAGAILKW